MLQPPTLRTNVSSLLTSNNNGGGSNGNSPVVAIGGSSSVVGSMPKDSSVATSPQDLEDLLSGSNHHHNSGTPPSPQDETAILLSSSTVEINKVEPETSSDISALVDSFFYNNGQARMTEGRKVFLFQISTVIGTFIFFIFYHFLYQFITAEDESTKSSLCWLLSYSLSIWCQYELHCRIVFGKRSNSEYWRSLIRTYFVYGISMVVSTILNYMLVGYFKVGHTFAWILSLVVVGILNYFTVSKFAFADSEETL